ncbi:hypothetical protein [Methylocystis silviterrae]|nr:hypothetical protein [Methylocystis silviterrae]
MFDLAKLIACLILFAFVAAIVLLGAGVVFELALEAVASPH